jgi:hypothetical protein
LFTMILVEKVLLPPDEVSTLIVVDDRRVAC